MKHGACTVKESNTGVVDPSQSFRSHTPSLTACLDLLPTGRHWATWSTHWRIPKSATCPIATPSSRGCCRCTCTHSLTCCPLWLLRSFTRLWVHVCVRERWCDPVFNSQTRNRDVISPCCLRLRILSEEISWRPWLPQYPRHLLTTRKPYTLSRSVCLYVSASYICICLTLKHVTSTDFSFIVCALTRQRTSLSAILRSMLIAPKPSSTPLQRTIDQRTSTFCAPWCN